MPALFSPDILQAGAVKGLRVTGLQLQGWDTVPNWLERFLNGDVSTARRVG